MDSRRYIHPTCPAYAPLAAPLGALVISDSFNHNLIVNGALASGATVQLFHHNIIGPSHLEEVLREQIVKRQPGTAHKPWRHGHCEGIYSMKGEFCKLPEIVAICTKYKDDVNTVSFAYRTVKILFSCSDDNPCKVWNRRCFAAIEKNNRCAREGHLDGITFIDSRGDGHYLISNDSCKTKNLQKLDEDEEYAQIMARIEELERMEELENGNTSKDNTQENEDTVVYDGDG
ncbi:uncharacterized protein LOC122051934 isoform X1 [Zingiber officinale]|uniref:uncharacterized protein LOC122051934 isoform X1 n=1 Tax=Zingiber officinale TaxID=94328 RepID=UPI001C4B7B1A|nr:uncharacterized protein LOC122051934 isoform X1 [Zingiber officinale]